MAVVRAIDDVMEAIPQGWVPPLPRELPALRAALAEHLRSPGQLQTMAQVLAMGKGTLTPGTGDVRRDADILLQEEWSRLAGAVLYFVTEDMTRLAMVAAETLPVHTFRPEDVPAERGFLVFAEPIAAYHGDSSPGGLLVPDDVVTIVAVSWGPSASLVPHGRGVWVTFWSMTDYDAEARVLREHGVSAAEALRRVRQVRSELSWDHEAVMGYGATAVATVGDNRATLDVEALDTDRTGWEQIKGTTSAWGQIVRATWLLLTQSGVTDVEQLHVSRTVRRQAERAGYDLDGVRVVRVRHRENTPAREESAGDRSYQVRWTVRGHWRNQWYPARQEHRPVWINPHIKGPDDAPLKTGDTVHLLDGPT